MFPYLRLLLLQRIATWNPARNLRAGRSKAKVIFSYLGFGVGALSLYGLLVVMEYFLYGAFAQMGEPQTMLALTGILCTVFVVVTSFFYVISELFFTKDVLFVSALPISSRALLMAKMIRIWLGEAGIALLVCLPTVVMYGVDHAAGVPYYLKALLLIPFMPMAPLTVVTLLSFALIRVSALWKRREALTAILSMGFLIAFLYAEMRVSFMADEAGMTQLLTQLLFGQKQVLDLLIGLYPPIRWFTAALTAGGVWALMQGLIFTLLNAVALVSVAMLAGGAYQRLAVKQSEARARLNAGVLTRADRHGVRSPLRALYRREMREIFMVPVYAMNSLAAAVMFPVISVAMMASAGSGSSELSLLPILLAMLPKPLMVAIATGVFSLTTCMNMAVATAVSREGKRHAFFQTLPIQPAIQLTAKLLMGLTVNLITSLPIAAVLAVMLPAFLLEIALGFAASLIFSTAMSTAALLVDVAHAKFGWKNETEAIKQNGWAALSMFGSMAFVAACGGTVFGLVWLKLPIQAALAILCLGVLMLLVLLLRRLFGKAARQYVYLETVL